MIGAVHDEGDTRRNHAKFSNFEFITGEIEMIFNVFLKIVDILEIIVIGVIPNLYVGTCDDIFQETEFVVAFQRECGVRFGCLQNFLFLEFFELN